MLKCRSQSLISGKTCFKSISGKRRKLDLDCTDLLFHLNDFGFCRADFFVNGIAAFHLLMLCKVAESFAFGKNNRPCIGRKLSYDHLEDRGFAGSIKTYKSSFFMVLYMKGSVFYDDLIPKTF